jgi:ATP-binding cassette subfamily F protein 3
MQGKDMYLSFNLEQIYGNANFSINDMDKVGITGVNGAGKTTLFNCILGKIKLDSGKIIIQNKKRIGYLPQEIKIDTDLTVYNYLLEGRPIKKLENEIATLYEKVSSLSDNKEINKILKIIGKKQDELELYDYYKYESILLSIIDEMHIDLDLLDLKVSDLSGGEKSKIAFARLIYSNPEILLLDEPTNHLDLSTRDYIINYLKNYNGMVLIISHDLSFLDAITNKTLYVDKPTKKIVVYEGNYSVFKKKYELQQELKQRNLQHQEEERDKLREIVLHYSNSSGNHKKMAQDREKKLSKLENKMDKPIMTYKRVKINIKPLQEGSNIPLTVNNLEFSYPNSNVLYHNLSFLINKNERFLIVGANGVGKSTLLKLIIGQLKPDAGEIALGHKEILAYYAQEQEILDLNKTILDNVKGQVYSETEARNFLGNFLFFNDDVYKVAKVLSPGEKARVCLCMVMMKRANILLLDEPTNHLDPETQKIIGSNFNNYPGTIIMVSHNPDFVKMVGVDRMLILPNGKITNYEESLLYKYKELNEQR